MRRPKFSHWIHAEVLRISGSKRFSLRRFSSCIQTEKNPELAAALLLYAHENNAIDKLMGLIYDEELRKEFDKVERHLGSRSIERLALRGTPMMSLPPLYRKFMSDYEDAYYTPERVAQEKRELSEQAREAALRTGASPAELARTLGVDRANLNAYLLRGETHRITLESARRLVAQLTLQSDQLQQSA